MGELVGDFYRVAIQYENAIGYIEYDIARQLIKVVLPHAGKKQEVEKFLTGERTISVSKESLTDFVPVIVLPTASLEDFQLAVTRVWEATDVHVDWSRPVKA